MQAKIDEHSLNDFLKSLTQHCNPDGYINTRFLPSAENRFVPLSKINTIPFIINSHKDQNCYFGVATRKDGDGSKEGIIEMPALYCDIDIVKGAPGYDHFVQVYREFLLKPSILIESGGGYHLYWLLKQPATKDDIPKVENILRRLAAYFGGDMAATDASRILRLPGTFNHKYNPPRRVTIGHFHPEKQYDLSDFDFLPELENETQRKDRPSPPPGWQNEILEGVYRGKRNISIARFAGRYVGKGLSREEILPILMDANSRFNPPLELKEIETILGSVIKTDKRNHPHDGDGSSRKTSEESTPKATPLVSSCELILLPDSQATRWVVDRLIPRGGYTLITAAASDYKTYLALLMGKAIAEGQKVLGRSTQKMKVYYVDRENPRDILSARLKQIGASENFLFYPLWVDPEPPPIFDPIYQKLAGEDVLFFFDSHKRFHKGDENSSSDMGKVSEAFRRLTIKGSTVVTLHHRGKSEMQDYRGSTEIIAGADVAFSIRRDQNILSFKCIKNRYTQEGHLTLEVQGDEKSFTIRDISDQKGLMKELERREQTLMIKEIISTLTDGGIPPVKTKIIEECLRAGISKGDSMELLINGEGTHWKINKGPRGALLFSILSRIPDFSTIGGGILESWRKPSESLRSSNPEGGDKDRPFQNPENEGNLESWNPEDSKEVVL